MTQSIALNDAVRTLSGTPRSDLHAVRQASREVLAAMEPFPIRQQLTAIDLVARKLPVDEPLHVTARLAETKILNSDAGKTLSQEERLGRATAIAVELSSARNSYRSSEMVQRESIVSLQQESDRAESLTGQRDRKKDAGAALGLKSADAFHAHVSTLKPVIVDAAHTAVRLMQGNTDPSIRLCCAIDLQPIATELPHKTANYLNKTVRTLRGELGSTGNQLQVATPV